MRNVQTEMLAQAKMRMGKYVQCCEGIRAVLPQQLSSPDSVAASCA